MYEATLLFSLVLFVAVAVAFARSSHFSMFHPLSFYLAFHGLLFVIRPIMAWLQDFGVIYNIYQFTPSSSDKLTALLAAQLGFVAFSFCCLRSGGVAMRFKQDIFVQGERQALTRIFPIVAAICLPIGMYSLLRLYGDASLGMAYSDMVRNERNGVAFNTTGNGYLIDAQLMLASTVAVIAWLFRFRFLALAPLIAFIVVRAGTGGRGPFITASVTVLLLYLYEKRARLPSALVMSGLAAALMLFNLVGSDRGRAIRELLGTDRTQVVNVAPSERPFEGMDFGNLEYLEYLVYVVPERSKTYGYFLNNFQIFTEPVPRVLWKGKPVGGPFDNIFLFDYGFPIGITRSLPGEGWFNLGWAGVALWCGLWGWILGWTYRRFVEGPQNSLQTLSYLIFLPILIIFFRDGLLITLVRQGVFFLAPILLWMLIARIYHIPSAGQVRAAYRSRNAEFGSGAPHSLVLPAAVRRRRLGREEPRAGQGS